MSKNILKLGGTLGASLLLAGLVHFTRTDEGYTGKGFPYDGGFSPKEISAYGERIRDIVVRDEMRNLSKKMARVAIQDPEILGPYIEMKGYSIEECEKCKWLESEEARRLRRIASDFGVGEVAYGLPDTESGINHFDEKGNPIESEKGAIGKLQLLGKMGNGKNGKKRKVGGFDEVYAICNKPTEEHTKFIRKYGSSLGKWGMCLIGTDEEVWSNIMHSEVANEVAGYMFVGYKKFNYGDINIALEIYNAGEKGRQDFPDDARKYREAVLARQREWEDLERKCSDIKLKLFLIEDKLAEMYFHYLIGDEHMQGQYQKEFSNEPKETYKSPAHLI